jgi:hypothetical protein
LQKTPGSVIVPCRARGMPMDHNFKVRTRTTGPDDIFVVSTCARQSIFTH